MLKRGRISVLMLLLAIAFPLVLAKGQKQDLQMMNGKQ